MTTHIFKNQMFEIDQIENRKVTKNIPKSQQGKMAFAHIMFRDFG